MAGLLALMLLHHARRAARTAPDGSLVPLAEAAHEALSLAEHEHLTRQADRLSGERLALRLTEC